MTTESQKLAKLKALIATNKPFVLAHIADRKETALLIGSNKTSRQLSKKRWHWV